MSLLLQIMFWVAMFGTVTSTLYCLMVIAAAVRFWVRKRREDRVETIFLPALSVLKPLHGIEPGLERNIESFFEQDYPEFELLFCARQESDQGLQLARRVGARYPQVDARYVTCGEPTAKFHNAKVFSLAKLDSVATYSLFVTSDADVRVTKDYLRRMVQNLKDPRIGLASCVYVGTTDGGRAEGGAKAGFSAQLDAVGKSVEMTSGVLVADMLEGTKFALGASMAVRKESFQTAGGFEELGQFYADDFVLGSRLAAQGVGVRMATHVIQLIVQDTPFGLSFRNQLRWMQSTRRSRPLGHLGSGLTFAMPFGLLGLAWGLLSGHALLGVVWLAAMVVNRWVRAGGVFGGGGGGERFYYGGKIYRLKDGGRVEEP